jgi:hypothetical protein
VSQTVAVDVAARGLELCELAELVALPDRKAIRPTLLLRWLLAEELAELAEDGRLRPTERCLELGEGLVA